MSRPQAEFQAAGLRNMHDYKPAQYPRRQLRLVDRSLYLPALGTVKGERFIPTWDVRTAPMERVLKAYGDLQVVHAFDTYIGRFTV